jgi:hypothetical protein
MTNTRASLSKKQRYERMRAAMESERTSFMSHWRDLNDYILPTRARFTTTDNNRGNRRTGKIIDSTGTIAARTLGSGMMSGITSPARPWFRLTTPDPDLAEFGAVKEWLYVTTERLRWILLRSNFYNRAPTIYRDLGVFGTSGTIEVEDDHRIVRFIDMPVGTFCYDVDEKGDPGILTRVFRMSVRQIIARFGWENVTRTVQDQWNSGNTEGWVDVVHVIVPNEDFDADALYAKENKKYYSCYYELSETKVDQFLRESGFEEFPGMIPVWEITGEDRYGTDCPGITALGDIKQLQTMEKRTLHAVEKQVNPALQGPTELQTRKVSGLPGEVTYLNVREGQQGLRPIHEVRFAIDQVEMKGQQTRTRIDRAFYADLFLMLAYMDEQSGSRDVTAAEIYERHEEKLLALGPVLEQLNLRLLDPVIDRTFNIAMRRGLIPPPPPDIHGVDLRVEYLSIMHQAQKTQTLGGLRSVMEFVGPMADRDPSVLDKIDTDRLIEHVGEAAGVPPDVIKPQDEVDKIRSARAAQQKAVADAERAKTESAAALQLSKTDTRGPNALTDLQRQQAPAELTEVPGT